MKEKTTIFVLLLLSSLLNAQQWYVLNSPTGGSDLKAVYFVSKTTGWVGGSDGIIMKTTDGGTSWTKQFLPTTSTILDIHFTNSQTGFLCCGNGKIFKTTNGGEDWLEKNSGRSYAMIGMYFHNSTNGYAVGGPTIGKGVILKTSDGGETWSSYDGPYGNQLRTAHFFSGSYGLVAGADGYIFKTDNGGKDWHKVYHSSTGTIYKMFYTSATTAYASAGLAVLLKTTEKDTNWVEIPITGVPNYTSANSLYFINANEGWVALDNGLIAHVTNGGVDIEVQNTGTTNDLKDIFFYNASYGWAVGNGGVLLSTKPGSQTSNISLIGQISFTLSKGPFYVDGQTAYVSMNNSDSHVYTLNIFDISNPASPVLRGSIDFQCCIEDISEANNYVYLLGPQNKLIIVDVSDPENPVERGNFLFGDFVSKLVVAGNYAYVANQANGLRVIDISNPDNPFEAGFYNTDGSSWDIDILGDKVYIADVSGGLRIIDVNNPTSPTEIGSYNTPSPAKGVYVSEEYAYITALNNGLRIIDVSDPTNPFETGAAGNIGTTLRISGSDNYVYVTAANVVNTIDVSDSSQPHIVDTYETESGSSGFIDDIIGINNYIYVADRYTGFYILKNDLISGENEWPEPNLPYVSIYPNPVKDEFSVQSLETTVSRATIQLFDINGKKILEKNISKGSKEITVDVRSLNSGLYFCRIQTEKRSVTKKLIVK